jgi:putative FmdB family regulatory protein
MPLYEYQCTDCKMRTEVLQKFSDPVLSECSECGGELERVLSVPSIRFKGSGWYVTDYSGKNSNGDSSRRASSESKEDSSDKKGASTESKTEQPSSSKTTS